MRKIRNRRKCVSALAAVTGSVVGAHLAHAQLFTKGNLVVSTSTYEGTASTVTVGQTLPGGGTAVANGSYPNVFNNAGPDSSFGVTSPIAIENLTTSGTLVNTYNVPTSQLVTSFSSKSELSLNFSTDGKSLTLMGYVSGINQLDVSNSNTPGIIEPGNPVTTTPTYRGVLQLDSAGNGTVTTTNAYAGNNPRAVILDSANNQYLAAGNAGNGNGSPAITAATGVQIIKPGQNATSSTPGTTQVGSFNITQYGYTADKTAKDNNFRGETIFNNTLYVTKGSGSNGINTVYQVGNAGTLPTSATAASTPITILPGFPTQLAKVPKGQSYAVAHPFGLFFANSTTLYVADEGDGVAADAGTSKDPYAGLEKWSLINNVWHLDYTLTNGLNLGTQYAVAGYPTSLNPATDGLRDLAGQVNGDGTVTLYAVTSTVSASGDQGADPNKLVKITDLLAAPVSPPTEQFSTLQGAAYGQVIRGVAVAPTPEPGSIALLGIAAGGLMIRRRAR